MCHGTIWTEWLWDSDQLLCTSALQASGNALIEADKDKARSAIQHISGQGVIWHGKLQSTSSSSLTTVFQGAAQQLLCTFPFWRSWGNKFLDCLQLLLYSCTYSNYTLPFEHNISFKYLQNANFFIYMLRKPSTLLYSLGNSGILTSLLSINYPGRLSGEKQVLPDSSPGKHAAGSKLD